MNVTGVATVVVLLVVSALHALGYYAGRSQLYLLASGAYEVPVASLASVFSAQLGASMVGILLAVPVSAVVGPAATAGLGLAAYAVAAGLAAAAPDGTTFLAATTAAGLGVGMYRPALWAALARAFPSGLESARVAAAVALYAGVNLAALPAPVVGTWLAEVAGGAAVLGASAAASGLGALAAAGLVLASFLAGPPDTEPARAGGLGLPVLAVSAGTVLLGGLGLAAWTLGSDGQYGGALGALAADRPWLWSLNPAVVLGTGLLAAVALAAAAMSGRRVPTLLVAGGGMVVAGLGLVPVDLLGGSLGAAVAVVALGAVGEALMVAPLFARACGDVHFRVAVLPAALLSLAMTLPSAAGVVLREATAVLGPWLGVGTAVSLVVGGGLLLAAALPAHRLLVAVEPEDDQAPV